MKTIRPNRRFNPYDVMADEGDITPEESEATRSFYSANLPLPPRPTDLADREVFIGQNEEHIFGDRRRRRGPAQRDYYGSELPPEPDVPQMKKERVRAFGESTPNDLMITAMVLKPDEEVATYSLQHQLGEPVDEEAEQEAKAEKKQVRRVLASMGFSREYIDTAQMRLWKEIVFLTQKFAYKMLKGRRDVNVDDIAHECAVRAFLAIDKFDGESKLSTWLYAGVQNTVRSFLSRANLSGVVGLGGLGLGIRGVPKGATIEGREDIYQPGAEGEEVDLGGSYEMSLPGERSSRSASPLHRRYLKAIARHAVVSREQGNQRGREQDAVIAEVFSGLSPDHQKILQLCRVRGTHQLPDGSVIETQGRLSQERMSEVLNIPVGTLQSRLGRARTKLLQLAGGRLSAPFTGELSEAYFGVSPQGIKEAVVGPTGHVEEIHRADVPGVGIRTTLRRPRANPYVGGTEFSYETAYDLLDLWFEGKITQEQYDVCMSDLEAEMLGVSP